MPAGAPSTQPAATQGGMFWTIAPPPATKPLLIPGWTGYVDVGGSGASGNSEAQNLRVGAGLKRVDNDDEVDTTLDAVYSYASSFGVQSKNQAQFDARRDWSFRPSPWGYFLLGSAEFDEFQPWTWRLTSEGGPSYAFIRNRDMLLRGRLGVGVTKELLGGNEPIDPEGVVGLDCKYRIDARQSMFGVTDYLPSMTEAPEYRLNSKVGWEIAVDKTGRLKLKLGVEDLYESSPADAAHRNDVNYFITLGWTF
jgi:putative salt-induced outer membrane protein YdiY